MPTDQIIRFMGPNQSLRRTAESVGVERLKKLKNAGAEKRKKKKKKIRAEVCKGCLHA